MRARLITAAGAVMLTGLLGCGGGSKGSSSGNPAGPGAPPLQATLTDPAGDNADAGKLPGSDLIAGTVTVDGVNAVITLQFAPGTFSAAASASQVAVDVDDRIDTGSFLKDFGIGIDYLVNFNWHADGSVRVMRYSAASSRYDEVGSIPPTVLPDGWRVSVPLAMLGGDDGRAAIRATSSTKISTDVFTGILDYMPDTTHAPARVQ